MPAQSWRRSGFDDAGFHIFLRDFIVGKQGLITPLGERKPEKQESDMIITKMPLETSCH
jgi:hypothetical protein